MHRKLLLLALLISAIVLTACGGSGGGPGGGSDTANLEVGEGADICDQFPEPVAQPYQPSEGSPLALRDTDYVLGAEDAPVVMQAYLDLADSSSAGVIENLVALQEQHPTDVRVVVRPVILSPASLMAVQAAESVGAQSGNDAYWQMVTLLVDSTATWAGASEEELPALLAGYAAEAGADADQVQADLDAGTYRQSAEETGALAEQIGITTPNVVANDLPIGVPNPDLEVLNQVLGVMLLRVTYHTAPPQITSAAKQYIAWIVTEKGTITVDLFADQAPQTVNNFAYLACSGYYDGVTFHRVLPGFVAQAGDPTGLGFGGPGYTVPDENAGSTLTFDEAGWLSMARSSQPDSARGQFFITLGPADHLNADFTIFGQVIAGLDVAQSITPRDPQSNPGAPPGDVIEEIVVREVE